MRLSRLFILNANTIILFGFILVLLINVFPQQENRIIDSRRNGNYDNQDKKMCKVFGVVVDNYGVVFPESLVTFKSSTFEVTLKTNNSGEYSVLLPNGIYEITTSLGYGLGSYKRARLNVAFCDKLRINIYAFPKATIHNDSDSINEYKFESLPKPFLTDEKLDILIAYTTKQIKENCIIYTDSFLTYTNYSVSAKRITQCVKERTIIAEGTAWIYDGKEFYRKAEKIIIKFTNEGLKVNGEERKL